jgi:hypothetical protein
MTDARPSDVPATTRDESGRVLAPCGGDAE